jgi:hypothetical protein
VVRENLASRRAGASAKQGPLNQISNARVICEVVSIVGSAGAYLALRGRFGFAAASGVVFDIGGSPKKRDPKVSRSCPVSHVPLAWSLHGISRAGLTFQTEM